MAIHSARPVTSATVRAAVIRNGVRLDLGVIAADYRNPLRRWWWQQVGLRLANRRIRRANQTGRS